MQEFELTINVFIREKNTGAWNNALEVRETLTVDAASFMDAADILGKFHELAVGLRKKTAE